MEKICKCFQFRLGNWDNDGNVMAEYQLDLFVNYAAFYQWCEGLEW